MPRVLPNPYPFGGIDNPAIAPLLQGLRVLVALLLVYVCANVAILVYARTATRRGEIAVRSALGASRRRIVSQLSIEALVLASIAAVVGVAVAAVGLDFLNEVIEGPALGLPFWIDFGVSPGAVMYVVVLTVIAATIVGVVPAVKATGHGIQSSLRLFASGGGGVQLGRLWTALIVGQVAVTVMILPVAVLVTTQMAEYALATPGFPSDQYLSAVVYLDRVAERGVYDEDDRATYVAVQTELVRRLASEPSVANAFITGTVPGRGQPAMMVVEDDTSEASAGGSLPASRRVGTGRVGLGFFDAFQSRILAGRDFRPGDLDSTAVAVVVNTSLVESILSGENAVGRSLRFDPPGGGTDGGLPRRYEVVGVVSDVEYPDSGVPPETVYLPLTTGASYPVTLVVRVPDRTGMAGAELLRRVAREVNPSVRLDDASCLSRRRSRLSSAS